MLRLRGHPNVLVGDEVVNDQGAVCAMRHEPVLALARHESPVPVASTQPQHAGCSALQQPLPATAPAVKPPAPRRSARRRASRWSGARASATWSGSASGTGCACGGRRYSVSGSPGEQPQRGRGRHGERHAGGRARADLDRRRQPGGSADSSRPCCTGPMGRAIQIILKCRNASMMAGRLARGQGTALSATDAVGRSPYRNTGESLAMRYPTRLWDESVVRPDPILDLLVSSQLTPPYTLAHLAHDGTSRRRRQQVPGTTMADCEPLPRAPALW